jgi:hypothetical protein
MELAGIATVFRRLRVPFFDWRWGVGSVWWMKLWAAVLIAGALLWPMTSQAKKSEDFRHSYDQVWGAAIRLIRVDQGFPIKDRDEGVGYFLFDYRDDGRTYPGSVELLRIRDEGAGSVRVVIQIPAMPSYIERMLLDKLERKLIEEYGEPAPAPREPAEDPPSNEED